MITGMHGLFYTTEPEAARALLRDGLELPAHDVGGGWLIFQAPSGDLGCHPSDSAYHAISLSCDDIETTMTELGSRGVEFLEPLREEDWGRVTSFNLPGGGPVQLYEPKY